MFLLFARVFSIVLALIAISKSYVDFKERKESVQMFLLWDTDMDRDRYRRDVSGYGGHRGQCGWR